MTSYISKFIEILCDLYSFIIIAKVLMSWFPSGSSNIKKSINDLADPYLDIIKKFVPTVGMMDFSPIIAIFLLDMVKNIILSILR